MEAPSGTLKVISQESVLPHQVIDDALKIGGYEGRHIFGRLITKESIRINLGRTESGDAVAKYGARSFFFGRFFEEARVSKEVGRPEEGIHSRSGVWGFDIPVRGVSEEEAVKTIWTWLDIAHAENVVGLKRVYDQRKLGVGFEFSERTAPTNRFDWAEAINRYRDETNSFGYKEWGWFINNEGKLEARDEADSTTEKLFDVKVVAKSDLEAERDLAGIIDNNLVGRVIAVTDDHGKVTDLEFLFNHFHSDGEQGIRLMQQVADNFEYDFDRENLEPSVLQKYWIHEKGDKSFLRIDIEDSYKMLEEEEKLYKMMNSLFDPKMSMTVAMAEGFIKIFGVKSGYVCVGPNQPWLGEKVASAGLQMAFLPQVAKTEHLTLMIKEALTASDGVRNHTLIADLMSKAAKESHTLYALKKLNSFMTKEIERARMGISTLAVLSAHIPGAAKSMFKNLLNNQYKFVSEGTVQISGIRVEKIPNVKFISAHNITTDNSIAINNLDYSKIVDIRTRTNEVDYQKAVGRLKSENPGMTLHPDNVAAVMKNIIRERNNQYRLGMAVIAMSAIVGSDPHNLEKKQEVYKLVKKIFDEVRK